jgi:triosephosphate isomerase
MRKPIIAGNWKMNKTVAEALTLVVNLRSALDAIPAVTSVVCPPFTALAPVKQALNGSHVGLGAQNLFWEEKGAFTGEVAPNMVAELCQYVILGTPPILWRNRCQRQPQGQSGPGAWVDSHHLRGREPGAV